MNLLPPKRGLKDQLKDWFVNHVVVPYVKKKVVAFLKPLFNLLLALVVLGLVVWGVMWVGSRIFSSAQSARKKGATPPVARTPAPTPPVAPSPAPAPVPVPVAPKPKLEYHTHIRFWMSDGTPVSAAGVVRPDQKVALLRKRDPGSRGTMMIALIDLVDRRQRGPWKTVRTTNITILDMETTPDFADMRAKFKIKGKTWVLRNNSGVATLLPG